VAERLATLLLRLTNLLGPFACISGAGVVLWIRREAYRQTGSQPYTLQAMQSTACDISPAVRKLLKQLPGLRQELYSLLVAIKRDADWYNLRRDFRKADPGDSTPYVDVTIGCTFNFAEGCITWNYQTGDNSFTGGAYGHPEWFTTSIFGRSNCNDIAKDLIEEIEGRIHELQSIQAFSLAT
jgi:hypothetical protein